MLLPPLSLYVHIPWCVRKCPYCDFNSHESRTIPEDDYTAQLIRDLNLDLSWVQGRRLTSIFFGGGTPSLFSPRAIARIIEHADQAIGFEDDIEITLEANPGTVEQDRFSGYKSAGVNRLSIGIQSFNDNQLRALGRIHGGDDALRAADSARAAGFDNFNLDLMHGLPGQSVDNAMTDLQQAVALAPTHLSWYQLTIEPNTAYYKNPPLLPLDDCLADIQSAGVELLQQRGYQQYEISAYSKPGKYSRHNRNYWQFGDYLGIGAGAHGKITTPKSGEIHRTAKTRTPKDYLSRNANFEAQRHRVEPAELPLEFFMNTLRLVDGVPTNYFEQRTGLKLSAIRPTLDTLVAKGLLSPSPENLLTTPKGLAFLNAVLEIMSENTLIAEGEK